MTYSQIPKNTLIKDKKGNYLYRLGDSKVIIRTDSIFGDENDSDFHRLPLRPIKTSSLMSEQDYDITTMKIWGAEISGALYKTTCDGILVDVFFGNPEDNYSLLFLNPSITESDLKLLNLVEMIGIVNIDDRDFSIAIVNQQFPNLISLSDIVDIKQS